jgi:NAD(P)-dependent dehydrogenase (short-subunit alcohol dehydrogenase family)
MKFFISMYWGRPFAMQAVIPAVRPQGAGSIVNVNSGTVFMELPEYSVYSSSKPALLGFSLRARAELEKDRIIVSEIYPFIPQPNFGKNRMGNPTDGGPPANYASGDMPESPVSFCKPLKQATLNTSPTTDYASWRGSRTHSDSNSRKKL